MIKNTTYDSDLIGHDLEEICEDSDIQSILDFHSSTRDIVNPEKKPLTQSKQSQMRTHSIVKEKSKDLTKS